MPTTFFQENTSLFGQSKDKGLSKEKKKKNTFHTVELGVRQYYSPKYYSVHVSLTYDALEKTDQALPRG